MNLKKYFWKIVFFILLTFFLKSELQATHLMGGELTYTYEEEISGGAYYTVKLIVYRYCDTSNGNPAALDNEMFLGIYTGSSGSPLDWYNTEMLILSGSTFVTAPPDPNCPFQPTACIERGEYYVTILLPDNADGYHLLVERCCRNGNIVNLLNPGAAGMSYYAFVPSVIKNSTPQISDISVPYICTSDTISIINNAFDPDGDSLTYSFVIPYNGMADQQFPMPDPVNNNPYNLPIIEVDYAPGYSPASIFGTGGYAYIDPVTGLTRYYIPTQGFFVAAIEIREYRNGVLISKIRRDLQFITIVCTPNAVPTANLGASAGVYSIPEGQQICFAVTFTDADGDSLFLQPSGQLLDPAITTPAGIMPAAAGSGIVTSQFCWTPVCGMSRPAPYQFIVTVNDNGCPQKTSSQVFSVYVTSGIGALTPTVSVLQTPPGILCQGSTATFHADATLSGSTPQFFWYVNGILAAGFNDSIYTPASIANGDQINVTMVSSATCLLTDTAFSSPFIASVNNTPAPHISISSNPSGNLCPQQICLFTATPVNGGAAPAYQWNINGNQAGTNQPLFTAANPSGVMAVYVTLTPSTGCPPEKSNTIVFNILPILVPQITLTANVVDSICPGQEVIFDAVSSSTGSTPIYNWFINGIAQGIDADTLVLNNLMDGDFINVSVTSTYPCLTPDFAFGQPLTYHIYPPVYSNLTDGPLQICAGLPVDLAMEVTGGQTNSLVYNWSTANSVTNTNSFVPFGSGYYYGSVDDYCYTPVTDSVYITVLPVPQSEFSWTPSNPSIFDMSVQYTDASIDAVSWNWLLGEQITSVEQHPSQEFHGPGIFPIQLITTNDVGCTDTLIKPLEVKNYITSYIPNSFTPNGDGINDNFGLTGFSTGGYTLNIFNRWGQEIFVSNGAYDSWNGKDEKGNNAPSGLYMYLFKINNDKTQKPITGTVTLIR